jgi:uncharacterized protein (TIGR01777 family)
MKVLVTGATGLIGSRVSAALRDRGDEVVALTRAPRSAGDVGWDPERGQLDAGALDGVDAVVHLAGRSIGEKKWTPDEKRAVLESRTKGTALLVSTLTSSTRAPRVLVSASAIGYYGDRGDEELTEHSGPGDGFLADLCVQWEAAVTPAEAAGIRTVRVRTGIVLALEGGALARMLLPFKLGLGGRVGSGKQWMSWIAIDDEVGAILHVLDHDDVRGVCNLVAPNPVRNAEFATTLGRVLHRPTVLPTPLAPLKLRFGNELVEQLLLYSQRVRPTCLLDTGYRFRHPSLADALAVVVG